MTPSKNEFPTCSRNELKKRETLNGEADENGNPSRETENQSTLSSGNETPTLGELKARAELIARGGSRTDAEEWFDFESKSLVSWAETRGCLLDPVEFQRLIDNLKDAGGGAEHSVFYVTLLGRVLKITKPPWYGASGELARYAENLIRSNELFADDIRFEGILKTGDYAAIVISQHYIIGISPTDEEISAWFEEQGFVKHPTIRCRWHHPETGITLGDAHRGNLLKMEDGAIFPIDLQVISLGNFTSPSEPCT